MNRWAILASPYGASRSAPAVAERREPANAGKLGRQVLLVRAQVFEDPADLQHAVFEARVFLAGLSASNKTNR